MGVDSAATSLASRARAAVGDTSSNQDDATFVKDAAKTLSSGLDGGVPRPHPRANVGARLPTNCGATTPAHPTRTNHCLTSHSKCGHMPSSHQGTAVGSRSQSKSSASHDQTPKGSTVLHPPNKRGVSLTSSQGSPSSTARSLNKAVFHGSHTHRSLGDVSRSKDNLCDSHSLKASVGSKRQSNSRSARSPSPEDKADSNLSAAGTDQGRGSKTSRPLRILIPDRSLGAGPGAVPATTATAVQPPDSSLEVADAALRKSQELLERLSGMNLEVENDEHEGEQGEPLTPLSPQAPQSWVSAEQGAGVAQVPVDFLNMLAEMWNQVSAEPTTPAATASTPAQLEARIECPGSSGESFDPSATMTSVLSSASTMLPGSDTPVEGISSSATFSSAASSGSSRWPPPGSVCISEDDANFLQKLRQALDQPAHGADDDLVGELRRHLQANGYCNYPASTASPVLSASPAPGTGASSPCFPHAPPSGASSPMLVTRTLTHRVPLCGSVAMESPRACMGHPALLPAASSVPTGVLVRRHTVPNVAVVPASGQRRFSQMHMLVTTTTTETLTRTTSVTTSVPLAAQ